MDGIIVFSKHDDVIFIHSNDIFEEHIYKKAKENGLTDEAKPLGIDANVVLQLYSPILMSQKAMIGKLHNAYHSITCQNGISLVFSQHQNDIYIAVTDMKEYSLDFVRRKLLIVQHMLNFLFGPVHTEIKPDRLSERSARWRLLSRLIETWEQLYKEEQCYLVEALERLHVNQMLNSKCIELLESTLTILKAAGEKYSLHAILFVNCKLLSLYSSRNAYELQTADIMLITILLKASFPTNQKLEDLFARSYSTYSAKNSLTSSMPVYIRSADGDRYESASEGHESEIEYFSTPSTPKDSPRVSREEFQSPTSYISQGGAQSPDGGIGDAFFTPSNTPFGQDKGGLHTASETSQDTDGAAGRTSSPANRSTASTQSASSSTEVLQDRYQFHPVFLSTPSCKVTPHTLHLIEALPGMSLVVVCEVPKGKQAGILYSTLCILWGILSGSHRTLGSAKAILETVDGNVKKVQDFAKKLKGNSQVERLVRTVHTQWGQAKEAGLAHHLDQRDRSEPSHRVEDSLSNMFDAVRRLFRALFIQPKRPPTEDFLGAIDQVRQRLRKQLRDYEAYLAVKAQRNIAITSYVEEFPGLVHFIFVDRTSHQMTAPSINISTEDVDKITAYVKKEIWRIYPLMQNKLQSGYMTVSARHGDFLFSYFLWYEDSTGNPIAAHQAYNGSITIPAGILAGPFYRQLLKQCFPSIGSQRSIHCYELLTVHVGIVPSQYALQHARTLVHRMWETSGEADSPISLL